MSMFEIQGYRMPWNGPYDLFLKVNPLLVCWILLALAFGLLPVYRKFYPKELKNNERTWWQLVP